ncbi:MAG TPA: STAS domain-containing protein [Steroidobacteraceae bacterium]|nr:STAS domain-containing protein [Steroidobacteraceae bacterium]
MSPQPPPPVFDLTSGPFRLVAAGSGRFTAEGPLTFVSAREARQLGLEALERAGGEPLEVDCQGITTSDSAGLAVLLDWLAVAKSLGRSLAFRHLPPGLTALGRISEVTELLERGVQAQGG